MKQPEIIIIAALGRSNRAIGKNGKLPWQLIPEDVKRFREVTLGHSVIMGRKTWEHDIEQCPLDKRRNIVITSTPDAYSASEASLRLSLGVDFVTSLPEALALVANAEKVFIVGGATIYAQALPIADTLDLTLVEGDYDADTFFPAYEDLRDREFHLAAEDVRDGFSFVLYRRNPAQ